VPVRLAAARPVKREVSPPGKRPGKAETRLSADRRAARTCSDPAGEAGSLSPARRCSRSRCLRQPIGLVLDLDRDLR